MRADAISPVLLEWMNFFFFQAELVGDHRAHSSAKIPEEF